MGEKTVSEEEKRIMKVFNAGNIGKIPSRTNESMKIYFNFLSKELIFPIKGESEEETAPMHMERHSIVLHKPSNLYDEHYGVLAEGRIGCKKEVVPLVDFTPDNENDENFQLIDDYKTWFCNY